MMRSVAFKEILARKAAQGVAVYVIFDSFGNLVVPHAFKVFPPAIHVLSYQMVRHPWQLLDLRRHALEHRKVLIVDGHPRFWLPLDAPGKKLYHC